MTTRKRTRSKAAATAARAAARRLRSQTAKAVAFAAVLPKCLHSKTAKAVTLAAVVLSAVTLLRAVDPAPIAHMRERSFDIYQNLKPRPYGDFPVRVVDIDEAS